MRFRISPDLTLHRRCQPLAPFSGHTTTALSMSAIIPICTPGSTPQFRMDFGVELLKVPALGESTRRGGDGQSNRAGTRRVLQENLTETLRSKRCGGMSSVYAVTCGILHRGQTKEHYGKTPGTCLTNSPHGYVGVARHSAAPGALLPNYIPISDQTAVFSA
jgi:hypothetical protein